LGALWNTLYRLNGKLVNISGLECRHGTLNNPQTLGDGLYRFVLTTLNKNTDMVVGGYYQYGDATWFGLHMKDNLQLKNDGKLYFMETVDFSGKIWCILIVRWVS